MKKLLETNLGKKLGAKGVYITLAACIIAAGGAGVAAYHKTVSDMNKNISLNIPDVSSSQAEKEKAADNAKTDVQKDSSLFEDDSETDSAMENVKTQPNVMPVNGEILNPFSDGELVKSETLGVWKTHDGVDIKADLNAPVKAMNKGKVIKVYEDPLLGNCIQIDHGNSIIGYYCSLTKEMNVSEGDSVNAGDVIGAVGDTAQSESAELTHLHFALKREGNWVDPIDFIQGSSSK